MLFVPKKQRKLASRDVRHLKYVVNCCIRIFVHSSKLQISEKIRNMLRDIITF